MVRILKLKIVYNYFYENIKFLVFRKQLKIKIQNFLNTYIYIILYSIHTLYNIHYII